MRSRAALYGICSPHYFLCDWTRQRPLRQVFDSILLDVPCSGLGTLRSNPDIRWRVREEDLNEYRLKQQAMLHNAFSALRPGGEVLYATCSTEPEENEEVVEQLLEERVQARRMGSYWRTFPEASSRDGFFSARIRHVSDGCATLA